MDNVEKLKRKMSIARTFTPSAPIDKASLFAGRSNQIDGLINAISQKGQHAILFGERGVGKTSLANVMHEFIKQLQMHFSIASTNCAAGSTFPSIWKSIFSDTRVEFTEVGVGFKPPTNISKGTLLDISEGAENTPEGVRQFLERLNKPLIAIIDEVDQIRTKGTTKGLADTIKTLSDHAVDATLILVGVADSVDQLIDQHVSIERALVQIPMPRMSGRELMEIIKKGLDQVEMTASDTAKNKISRLSQGLPHYTHLLALHSAQSAVERDDINIELSDVETAVNKSVEQAQQSIVSAYIQATTSRRGNLYAQVITACALCYKDELGYFSAADVREPMTKIMGRPYDIPAFSQHLNDFCEQNRGAVLQKSGYPRRYRFRFMNPLMEPFAIMKALSKNLIAHQLLEDLGR